MRALKIFSGSAHITLTQNICQEIGIPLGRSEVIHFSNENMMVKIHENVRGADVFFVQPSCAPVSDGILETLIAIDALRHASADRITAVLPYFPYSRSDKKDQPRISIAARLMADLLQAAGADRVLTVDLHSPQVQGFFRIPVDQLKAARIITDYLRNNLDLTNYVLVAGDAGEAKDLGRYANLLDLPMAIVDKRRYANNDKPKAVNIIGNIENKRCMIVDDEIASGGTIVEAANFLVKKGAISVSACCVHPILSGTAIQKIADSQIERLITTDSVPIPDGNRKEWMTILSIAPLLAQAIKHVHSGESVSSLFV